ncbi:hypothetical protein O9X81_23450 [Agrobacterium salinitolerans]|uniref:hypothetical protein n=1 Tax=Agrobacterium salinitolerans TaxID=1183413 RepID=UPI0022B83B5C|nr:hypothetical protein [Agrobacterium salinitolerans]MCZ7859557.1 hypothetical protein [Agrobacterium salinitolerans]
MRLKLALSVVLSVTFTAAAAEARTQLHLYGTVPVTGNRVLEMAYQAALDRCSIERYRSYGDVGFYVGAYGSVQVRSCMYSKGFVVENGEPFAYPVKKATYLSW